MPPIPVHAEDAALVVGIEDYAFLPDVPYADNDARAFAEWLVDGRKIPADRVQSLRAASREKLLAAVDTAAKSAAKGVVWIYFAGHGMASPTDGRRMVLGVDAQPEEISLAARGILLDEITARAGVHGATVMLVVDACYSGVGRDGASLGGEGKRPARAVSESVVPPRTFSWLAASSGEVAGPIDGAQHGAFTWFTLQALAGAADGAVDGKLDGSIAAGELRAWVTSALRKAGNWDQTPQWRTDDPSWLLAEGIPAARRGKVAAAPQAATGRTAPVRPTTPFELKVSLAAEEPGASWRSRADEARAGEIALPTCARFRFTATASEAAYVVVAYAQSKVQGSLVQLWPTAGASVQVEAGEPLPVPGDTAQAERFFYLEPPRQEVENVYLFASSRPLDRAALARLVGTAGSIESVDEDILQESWKNVSLGQTAWTDNAQARVTTQAGGVAVYHLRITHGKAQKSCPSDWKLR